MKLYTLSLDGSARLGVETADGRMIDARAAVPASDTALGEAFANMLALIDAGDAALDALRVIAADPPEGAILNMDGVRILPPLPPRKFSAFSSFDKHLVQSLHGTVRMLSAKESDPDAAYASVRTALGLDNFPPPGWYEIPAYYYPDITAICGQDQSVACPAYSDWLDFELELVAVIGRGGKDIARADAMQHIFGYSILNDLSARDMQLKSMKSGGGPGKGKDFDHSNPFGPCIVTADAIADPFDLDTCIRVNGEEWIRSSTRDPHWTFADFLAHASQSQTIRPGEIFTTGCTPYGCAVELERKVGRGDRIELEVAGIGTLRTLLI